MSDKKVLDLSRTIHALASDYPEIVDLMAKMGFQDILKPGMLNTAGRFMTLEKGANMKKIPLADIISQFEAQGFTVKR